MYRGSSQINTATGLFIISVMAAGCLFLVVMLKHYTALADTISPSLTSVYTNETYGFGLNLGDGWPRLTVIEKKESLPGAQGVTRVIYFLLPTEDAYYLNGFAHPLVIEVYTLADAERLRLPNNPRFLGVNSRYAFVYRVWDEFPSDLADLEPTPRRVAQSFYLLK